MTNDNSKPFQILALSGGGYRGLFVAEFLSKLEEEAKKPIGQCFDLICGTSIGGIIAMGIGIEKPMSEIAQIIKNQGKNIFKKEQNRFLCSLPFFRAKYSNKNLESIVKEIFGSNNVFDSKHRLVIPSVNYNNGKMRTFKTKHLERLKDGFDVPMWQAAMATSAAPTYFPIWENPKDSIPYVDGGLVANAPGLLGVHEAIYCLGKDNKDIHLLSVGTMGSDVKLGGTNDLNRGIFAWGKGFFNLVIFAQENMVNDMLNHILTTDRYHYINPTPAANQQEHLTLDNTSQESTNILIGHANSEAQSFVGIEKKCNMLNHTPEKWKEVNF